MRQSLKTRLLSAAYKAACAFAEKVFAFTEQLRQQKEYAHTDDLYEYRDALTEELREGEELARVQSYRNEYAAWELAVTEREIYGPTYTPTCTLHKVQDFDDLPAPQGVDEDEAPEGYKAVAAGKGCTGCSFDPLGDCPLCPPGNRGDGQAVVFVRR